MTTYEDHLRWRGVEIPCIRCHGTGIRTYGSTSTWRGGMGGASMTPDVCDNCWGSGDEDRHWMDLRHMRDDEDARIAKRAAALLFERSGVRFRSIRPGLKELVAEIARFARGRKKRAEGFDTVCRTLSSVLSDMIKTEEDEETVKTVLDT